MSREERASLAGFLVLLFATVGLWGWLIWRVLTLI